MRTRQGEPGLAGWRGQALSLKGEGQHGPAQAGLRKAGGWPRASLAWLQTMSAKASFVREDRHFATTKVTGASGYPFCVDALTVRHVTEADVVAEQRFKAGGDLGQPALCPRRSGRAPIGIPIGAIVTLDDPHRD